MGRAERLDAVEALTDLRRFQMVGRAPAFVAALHLIKRVAQCDATALIEGETGTGKELAARAIHYLGSRAPYPFIPVNCGAIPDELVENELFGHERGAYTDARDSHRGLITDALGGTLFLDEVESLSVKAQVALLRFLQDGIYKPLGAKNPLRSNVRVIAASNADLHGLARAGKFRGDLLYRLAVMVVRLPPLRERDDDVVLLAEHFLERFANQYGRRLPSIAPESLAVLLAHDWPGNVRELENLIHREFVLADDNVVRLGVLACGDSSLAGQPVSLSQAKAAFVHAFERSFVARAIEEAQGNVSVAARRCGKERRAFGKLLKKHAIDRLNYVRD